MHIAAAKSADVVPNDAMLGRKGKEGAGFQPTAICVLEHEDMEGIDPVHRAANL